MATYFDFCVRLNSKLTNLQKKGIGPLPISNLELEMPEEMSAEEITSRLVNDGVKAIVYEFTDGTEIYVQCP